MLVYAFMVPHPPIAVPEIGRGEEKKIQDTLDSFAKTAEKIASIKPDTIILSTPHATMYRDWFTVSANAGSRGSFASYRRPDVQFAVRYDEEFTAALDKVCRKENIHAGTEYEGDPELDQGTMVPLYFIQKAYTDFRLVRIGLSGFSLPEHYRFGKAIQSVCEKSEKTYVYVASGDLSHCQLKSGPYGLHPEGPEYDRRLMETMRKANFGELLEYDPQFLARAEECGHRSFCIMAGALDGYAVNTEIYSHEATFGVGYGFAAYEVTGRDENRHFLSMYMEKKRQETVSRDPYVKLARASITSWVKDHRRLDVPSGMPDELYHDRAGAFVSIHEFGELRGCIGTIMPVYPNLAQEIIANGISASTRDPRFDPITVNELPYLSISVDVLGTPEHIPDKSFLNPNRYGVICSVPDGRRGLLLPALDGVNTAEEQIQIACRKGGIDPDDPNLILERFEVVRHE